MRGKSSLIRDIVAEHINVKKIIVPSEF